MKKINWKVRFKNPVFIGQVVLAIFVPILAYLGLTFQDLTSWRVVGEVLLEALINPYVLVLVAVSIYNATTDPTTNGIGDSHRAMQYDEPNKDI